jgi:hypothetical protein
MGLYPFFRNKQIAGGRCSFCDKETPLDLRKPSDSNESIMKKVMEWYETHQCKLPAKIEHG